MYVVLSSRRSEAWLPGHAAAEVAEPEKVREPSRAFQPDTGLPCYDLAATCPWACSPGLDRRNIGPPELNT